MAYSTPVPHAVPEAARRGVNSEVTKAGLGDVHLRGIGTAMVVPHVSETFATDVLRAML